MLHRYASGPISCLCFYFIPIIALGAYSALDIYLLDHYEVKFGKDDTFLLGFIALAVFAIVDLVCYSLVIFFAPRIDQEHSGRFYAGAAILGVIVIAPWILLSKLEDYLPYWGHWFESMVNILLSPPVLTVLFTILALRTSMSLGWLRPWKRSVECLPGRSDTVTVEEKN